MRDIKKFSIFIRSLCGVLSILGFVVFLRELMIIEQFDFQMKYIAIPVAILTFGFVAIVGANPMDYLDKYSDAGKDKESDEFSKK